MKTIHIKKTKFGFQHCLEPYSSAPTWRYFGPDVKTADDMRRYFETGRHSNDARDSLRDINLFFVDQDNKVQRHYKVRIDNASGLHSAVVDYDDNKKKVFTTAQLWNEADQLAYLRQSAVHLPEEYDSVKSALAYLAAEEPFTVEEYHAALKQKLTDTITAECQQHAAGTPAVVEFTD